MQSSRFPIPQGTLDMLILRVLSLEPAHGYAIARRLQQISRDVVPANQGSLYPALHRLEQKRWLKSEWRQSETGREAKSYSLTRAGRTQLAVDTTTIVGARRCAPGFSSPKPSGSTVAQPLRTADLDRRRRFT
jgi:PadR family transcriptional regulator PadR